jgi:hypothetical protein
MVTKTKALCSGCDNDFYNTTPSVTSSDGCFMYPEATLVKRIIVTKYEVPPYDIKSHRRVLSCWRSKHYVPVNPLLLTKEGYWR